MAKSKRINFLAELCQGYHKVIDIGTDHGLVLKKAFEKGYIKEAIASDLREQPLKSAMKNLRNYPVTYVLSDGFLSIKENVDLAIIAGMGAYLICDILDHAPANDTHYLIQANDKVEVVRAYLMNHGFEIMDEHIVFDQFFYIIIHAKRGQMILSEEDIYLGPYLKHKKDSILYFQQKVKHIEKIMKKADKDRQEELLKMLKIYENL